MRGFIDNDVLLDVGLKRLPFFEESDQVLRWAEAGGDAWVAWHSLANCHYMIKRNSREFLRRLLLLVRVAETDTEDARRGLTLPMSDFEDALQAAAALACDADLIVTRNIADFRRSPVPAVTPGEFLVRVRGGG